MYNHTRALVHREFSSDCNSDPLQRRRYHRTPRPPRARQARARVLGGPALRVCFVFPCLPPSAARGGSGSGLGVDREAELLAEEAEELGDAEWAAQDELAGALRLAALLQVALQRSALLSLMRGTVHAAQLTGSIYPAFYHFPPSYRAGLSICLSISTMDPRARRNWPRPPSPNSRLQDDSARIRDAACALVAAADSVTRGANFDLPPMRADAEPSSNRPTPDSPPRVQTARRPLPTHCAASLASLWPAVVARVLSRARACPLQGPRLFTDLWRALSEQLEVSSSGEFADLTDLADPDPYSCARGDRGPPKSQPAEGWRSVAVETKATDDVAKNFKSLFAEDASDGGAAAFREGHVARLAVLPALTALLPHVSDLLPAWFSRVTTQLRGFLRRVAFLVSDPAASGRGWGTRILSPFSAPAQFAVFCEPALVAATHALGVQLCVAAAWLKARPGRGNAVADAAAELRVRVEAAMAPTLESTWAWARATWRMHGARQWMSGETRDLFDKGLLEVE